MNTSFEVDEERSGTSKMAATKFQKKLNSFLDRGEIHENDFVTYIAMLNDLTKLLEQEKGFPIYAAVVKSWISGFQTIFSDHKTRKDAQPFLQTYMSKFCANITKIFFILLQCFRQFDPNYTEELYIHWNTILARMNGLSLGDSFRANVDKFKIVVQLLRTAASRTEQIAILSVLRRYIECVPIKELRQLYDVDNVEIVAKLAKFMQNPTALNQHAFLHDIDALGHCIESVKPTKIICKKLKIDMDDTNYEMWLDFNKTEKTIIFTTVSLADGSSQTYGHARRITLRESVHDDRLLEINGIWNVISETHNCEPSEERVTTKVFFLVKTEQLLSIAVKNTFRIANASGGTASVSQGFVTDFTEPEPTLDVPERKVSSKLIPLGRLENNCSLPTPPKPFRAVQRLNSSLPLFPHTGNENEKKDSVAKSPIKSTNVIRKSVPPRAIGTRTGQSHSDDPNATYVLRKSVNPLAEQPENDHDNQNGNYDEMIMDYTECPTIQSVNGNESAALNRTYTIDYGALSDISNEADRLVYHSDADVNSKLLHRDDTVPDEDYRYDLENEGPQGESQDNAYSRKKVEIIENIMIVPPRSQPAKVPMGHLRFRPQGNIKYLRVFSQVDERISVNRKVAFTEYSQPTTSRERYYVKDSSFQSRNIEIVQSNDSIERLLQRPTEVSPAKIHFGNRDRIVDELNGSVQSNRKRSKTPISKQNTCNDTSNVSSGVAKRSQPIAITSQYDSFVPIAMSTQRSPVKLQEASHSQQASQLSLNSIELLSQTAHHIGSSQEKAGSLKINKSLSRSEVLSQANKTSESSQAIDKKIESNAGIKSSSLQNLSSQNATQKQVTSIVSPKRTKCIAIADLPKMSQIHIGPTTESQKEPKSSKKDSKATPKFTSTQEKSEKPTPPSIQQRTDVSTINPHTDVNLSELPLDLSRKRAYSSRSQLQSTSSLQPEHNSKELQATINSSPKQAVPSTQQVIQRVPFIDPYADMESSQKSKRIKLAESAAASQTTQMAEATSDGAVSRNSTQKLSSDPQRFDNATIIDLPEDMDCFPSTPSLSQNVTEKYESQAKLTTTKVSPQEMISSDNPKISTAKNMRKSAARKLNSDTLKTMFKTIAAPLKIESKCAPRYSSLRATKPGVNATQPSSQNGWECLFDDTEVTDQCNELDATVGCSDKKTLKNECITTDDIRVDEHGTVYDDKGCVFADNDELQRAVKFYIANDGMDYLKKESVAGLPARKLEKYERKLRTIRRMIDHGLEELHKRDEKIKDLDPYAITVTETTIQGGKRKRRIKAEVSVTLSKKSIVDHVNKVIFRRRTSKLYCIVDEGALTNPKVSQSTTKNRSMSKSKKLVNRGKTAQTVKTPQPSVNLTEGKITNRPKKATSTVPSNRPASSSKCDLSEYGGMPMASMNEGCADVNITPTSPASASNKMEPKQSNEIPPPTTVMSLPVYASDKMIETSKQKAMNEAKCDPPPLRPRNESPSTNIDCLASASKEGPIKADDNEMERAICSTTVCDNDMRELIAHLNGIVSESVHDCRGSCEQNKSTMKTFIDRLHREQFHQDHTVSDWAQLLNCVLESVESMCKAATDQLQTHHGQCNEQVK